MFAITHILYSSAFGMKPLDLKAGLMMGLISSSCYAFLYSYLSGPFTYLVAVYIALIGFMGWRAVAGMQLCNDLWTWTKLSACIGAMPARISCACLFFLSISGCDCAHALYTFGRQFVFDCG